MLSVVALNVFFWGGLIALALNPIVGVGMLIVAMGMIVSHDCRR